MGNDEATRKPGPKPDHLKIAGPWEDAVKKALEKRPQTPSEQPDEPDQPDQDQPPEKD